MTKKQQLWLDYYQSGHSAQEAAKLAGYGNGYRRMAQYNMMQLGEQYKDVQLTEAASLAVTEPVADMREITAFWTRILRDEGAELKDQLKVSELLAKVQGAFSANYDDESEKETHGFETLSLTEKLALIQQIRTGDAHES